MNMQRLKRSRKPVSPGDIIVYQMLDRPFGFGRVIRTDCTLGHFGDGVILMYIYDAFAGEKTRIPLLDKSRLLIPPFGINRLPWPNGYFETVAHRTLEKGDILPLHCFEDAVSLDDPFKDEYGKPLAKRTEPCGLYALDSYRSLDADLSDALGIPLAPDTI